MAFRGERASFEQGGCPTGMVLCEDPRGGAFVTRPYPGAKLADVMRAGAGCGCSSAAPPADDDGWPRPFAGWQGGNQMVARSGAGQSDPVAEAAYLGVGPSDAAESRTYEASVLAAQRAADATAYQARVNAELARQARLRAAATAQDPSLAFEDAASRLLAQPDTSSQGWDLVKKAAPWAGGALLLLGGALAVISRRAS